MNNELGKVTRDWPCILHIISQQGTHILVSRTANTSHLHELVGSLRPQDFVADIDIYHQSSFITR
jgi:hypothetical protein